MPLGQKLKYKTEAVLQQIQQRLKKKKLMSGLWTGSTALKLNHFSPGHRCEACFSVKSGGWDLVLDTQQKGVTETLCIVRNDCSQVLIIMTSEGMTTLILLVSIQLYQWLLFSPKSPGLQNHCRL